MERPAPARGARHILWWFGAFVFLGVVLLLGPIWTCRDCAGVGSLTLAPTKDGGALIYKCPVCGSLGRIGILRYFHQTPTERP